MRKIDFTKNESWNESVETPADEYESIKSQNFPLDSSVAYMGLDEDGNTNSLSKHMESVTSGEQMDEILSQFQSKGPQSQ